MLLRSLEMQGFKSFPDKTELNFGKGITAVVGPNGSGKSNISDAVRWVLGETSTKSLRGAKMEDVIFGGTSTRKALGFAQVTLVLDNSDETLKDKGNIVTVSRRYYRSGESEYKIDGEQVRRKDIHELFMDTGLGADGYSIVGQGKIDSIISAKNEDRRELFEEAAGISRFRHKRTDAQRRLDQAQENLVRLLDILGELESRVGPLKTQSEKAQKFLELSSEKKELEIGVWLNKINRFTNELREQEHKIDAANASYEYAENELKSIENEIEEVLSLIASINSEIENTRLSSSEFEEEALKKDGEVSVLETTLSHNNETIERLKSDISLSDNASASIENQIEEKKRQVEENNSKIAEKRSVLEELTESAEKLSASNENFSAKAVSLNSEISRLTLELSDSRVKSSEAQSSINEIESRIGTVFEAIENANEQCKEAQEQNEQCKATVKELKDNISELTNSMGGYQLKFDSKSKKTQQIKDKLSEAQEKLLRVQNQAKMLTDLEKNMEGYSGAVKAVVRRAESNALSGIHGTLGRLITVDDEYSTAVEVALGAAMQNIVTENEADAKRAILYLKQNNLGRATFLPLSAIQPRSLNETGLDDFLGFVDFAQNLVKCDKKYQKIVSNLLGKTVVAEDMDSAIGISKQYKNRFRIVTLDGQVINPGGSMTGGSRSNNAGILSRANRIEELNAKALEIEKSVESLKAECKTASEEESFALAELQGAQADLQNAGEDLIRAEGEERLAQNRYTALCAQRDALLSENENAAERVSALKKLLEGAEGEIKEISSRIESTQEELDSITGNNQEIVRKRDEIRSQIEEINLELVAIVKENESSKISVEELKGRISGESERVRTIENEISEIESRNEEIKKSINGIKEQANALREKVQQSEKGVSTLIDRRNSLEKRSSELRLLERQKGSEREKLSSELVRLDERKIAMRKEYDELNDMLFEQYELTRREAEALNIQIGDISVARRRLNEIKQDIKKLGSINVGAIEEYKEVSERYEFLKEQIDDIEKAKSELGKIIEDLTSSMSERFLNQFKKINEQFKISFADFFGGGKGEIILEDERNCLECAIEIKIQPPGKSVQNINLFSGGEKSLAALALLFSVLKVTPSPFCIYDEVEAALDDVNVERFAKYMRRMTEKTQFISITHRRGTMEEADILYGVTMQEKGVSKLLELQSAEIAQKMGLEG